PAAHPHLPSFPTRRSSDLRTLEFDGARLTLPLSASNGRRAIRRPADDFIQRHLPLMAVRQTDDGHAEVQQVGNDREERGFLPAVDRKSTRLNSSHVEISYA